MLALARTLPRSLSVILICMFRVGYCGRVQTEMPEEPSVPLDPYDQKLYGIIAALVAIILVMYARTPALITPEVLHEMNILPKDAVKKAHAQLTATKESSAAESVPVSVPVPLPAAAATPAAASIPAAVTASNNKNKSKNKSRNKKEKNKEAVAESEPVAHAQGPTRSPTRIAIAVSSDDDDEDERSSSVSDDLAPTIAFGTKSKFQIPAESAAKPSAEPYAAPRSNFFSPDADGSGGGSRRRRVSFDTVIAPDVIALEEEKKRNEKKLAKAERQRLAEQTAKEAEVARKEAFLKQLAASEAAALLEAQEREERKEKEEKEEKEARAWAAKQFESDHLSAAIAEIERATKFSAEQDSSGHDEEEWEVVDKRASRSPNLAALSNKKGVMGKKFSVGLASQAPLPALQPPPLPEPKPFVITVPDRDKNAVDLNPGRKDSSRDRHNSKNLGNGAGTGTGAGAGIEGSASASAAHVEHKEGGGRGRGNASGRGRGDASGRGRGDASGRGRGDASGRGRGDASGRGRGRAYESQGTEVDTCIHSEHRGVLTSGKSELRSNGSGLHLNSSTGASGGVQAPIRSAILTGIKTAIIPITSGTAAPGSNRKSQLSTSASSAEAVRTGHSSSFD